MRKYRHCLVTGGAGFIGSHLVDALTSRGWTVTVLDDFSTGLRENLPARLRRRGIRIVRGDVRDPKIAGKAIANVNVVFHLAALSSHRLAVKEPMLVNDVNVGGTVNLLEQAVKADAERFVFASSAAVYGEPPTFPIREDSPTRPESPYGASKLAAEKYCEAFQRTYGLEAVCLRYFNVYGPRQRTEGEAAVVPEFLSRVQKEKPLRVYGRGRQVRDFIYVDDAVEATILAAETNSASGAAYNIGTGRATSILALANQITALAGLSGILKTFEKPRPGDILHSCADTSRAKATMGFRARTTLRDGLTKLTHWQTTN